MSELPYTLVSDGSSDVALLPILDWLLAQHRPEYAIQGRYADLRQLRQIPETLSEKIKTSLDLYPCRLLFIHRDAENQTRGQRQVEIKTAIEEAGKVISMPFICVIPIRMTEAWLLFNESAIRRAAGNPNGRERLALPRLRQIEEESDPKAVLYNCLRDASGLSGRRLKRFNEGHSVRRVSELIDDFSPLRSLTAFQALEADIQAFAATLQHPPHAP